ncbi:MAG: cytochrome o ubiquinol oxidase subunit II [Candidatus Tokpelaia sp. JSC161]|jgi:cytochrome o ubiquinol oxidase subunit 2|nr:MAG: cytochrome o ubiquinol oxidase subunit II [Candidatus Tokpelaia sp. JSC161]
MLWVGWKKKIFNIFAIVGLSFLLSACKILVLQPEGLVAKAQRTLIITSFVLMLCIVIPVMIAIVVFAIKYHVSNKDREYLPEWSESYSIECFTWGVPILIITVLAILSGYFTYRYEPSKSLPILRADEKSLQIDAIALEWKWLFIYPEYGIATINEIYAPTGQQVFMQLTAESVMNAFWVPQLGTVIYAMPQMNAKLHLFSEKNGSFIGMPAHYSGEGFSGMGFKWYSVSRDAFENWVARVRQSSLKLDRSTYVALTRKSKRNSVLYFSGINKDLYYRVVNRCVLAGSKCNEDLMRLAAGKSLWGRICSVFDDGVNSE